MKKILLLLSLFISFTLSSQVTAKYGVQWGNSTNCIIDSVDIIGSNDSVAIYTPTFFYYSSTVYAGDSSEFVGSGIYNTFPLGLRIGSDLTNPVIYSIREGVGSIVMFFTDIGFVLPPSIGFQYTSGGINIGQTLYTITNLKLFVLPNGFLFHVPTVTHAPDTYC